MCMTNRERFARILNHSSDHCGFWHGCPNPASVDYLYTAFDVKSDFELGKKLSSTCRWCMPDAFGMWRHPEGKPMFDVTGGKPRVSLGQPGVFAECESVAEVEAFDWPDEKYVDFTRTIQEIDRTIEAARKVMKSL